jgi:hypothetical protein
MVPSFFFSEASTHPIHIPTDLFLLEIARTIDFVRKIFSDKFICVAKHKNVDFANKSKSDKQPQVGLGTNPMHRTLGGCGPYGCTF